MVTPGDSERERTYKLTETVSRKRSKPLHNFLIPGFKWGNSQILRCVKVNSDGDKSKIQSGGSGGDDSLEEIRARLMFLLRAVARKMNSDIPEEDDEKEEVDEDWSSKPLNLRKKRVTCDNVMTSHC